jgi:hypothetical protein
MARETYVFRNGRMVRKDRALPVSAGPMVQSDYLGDQLEHHGYSDGRRTDSKSTFRRWTKEAGLVEKGNDRERTERRLGDDRKQIIRDVALATEMVKNGYRPQIRQFEE